MQVPSEEAVSYKLTRRNGRVLIEASDGAVIPWSSYTLTDDSTVEQWAMKYPGFVKAGVHLYTLAVWRRKGTDFWDNPFWSPDGKPFDPGSWDNDLDATSQTLMDMDSQARFMVRFGAQPSTAWKAQHQSEYVGLDNLAAAQSKNLSVNPSLASDLYIQGLGQMVRDVVRWCEAKPWRNRIVGYSIFPFGEGTTEPAIEGLLFDHSLPMQQAFRDYIRHKYHTDDALRQAWADRSVTLDTVRVPTEDEWRARRSGLMHWPDPAQTQRERDYFALQEKLFARYVRAIFDALAKATRARPVLKGADLLKQPMQGWTLTPEFFGTWGRNTASDYPHLLLATGSVNATPLLDHQGLDMLQTPGIYYNRAMGFAWEAEGLSDSLTLRGKVNFMEADMRTWVSRDAGGNPTPQDAPIYAGTFRDEAEMRAGFDRTLAWAISRNQMFYYMSVCGADWWYHAPTVFSHIARQRAAIEAMPQTPWRETRDAICLVIDEEAAQWEDFSSGFQHLAVFRQLQEGLALCGIPYRIHLLKDLERDDFPRYKTWLFPNLFRVDDDILALLRKRVLRDGNVAVFGPGTGITDGQSRSSDGATKLLGVPMELVPKTAPRRVLIGGDHPLLERLPTMTYGDNYAFGPILAPSATRFDSARTTARSLGSLWSHFELDRPGLFINEFGHGAAGNGRAGARADGDYAVVFSPAIPLPPELLRECARYAGSNVWSESNGVVYASDTFVALHSIKTGRHAIHLPRRCRVLDFYSRQPLGTQTDAIEIEIKAPETRMFLLE